MTNNVRCDEFAERMADLLERDVDEVTRAALEAHALACDECGSLLADLRKLRIDASNLPVLAPSRDLWPGVVERIDAPVIPLHVAANERPIGTRRWQRWIPLTAAAAVLVALTSATTYYLTARSRNNGHTVTVASTGATTDSAARGSIKPAATLATRPPTIDSGAAEDRSQTSRTVRQRPSLPPTNVRLASSKPSAEQVYAREIARLHAIVEQRRTQLDPITVSVIERNLKVIDDAIAQCKLALAKDPASRFLMESLNNALETKVELLRTAALLPARS